MPEYSYRIHLKVFPSRKVPPEVKLHHVPVFYYSDKKDKIAFSDLTASAIIREIDGSKHIHRICGDKISHVLQISHSWVKIHLQYAIINVTLESPELACRTVRDLVFKDICYIRDIFQYTNRYAVTPKLRLLYQAYIREKMKSGNGFSNKAEI